MQNEAHDRGLAPILERSGVLALFLAGLAVACGTVWAFQRGGRDFTVFHSAWSMVLQGNGATIYDFWKTPDRFLYAPGFAWLLSPFALLSRNAALGLWCLLKAATVGLVIRELARIMRPTAGPEALSYRASLALAAWALVLVARPFLIDLEYGQVNIFILGVSVWALSVHFDRESRPLTEMASWALLAFAAAAKIFPLPLLLVPWLVSAAPASSTLASASGSSPVSPSSRAKIWRERIALVGGGVVTALAPLMSLSFAQTIELYRSWLHALESKGLPLESHNQSFVALLHHYFSGQPTFVLSEGLPPLPLGTQVFSSEALTLISLAWTFLALGALVAWLIRGPRGEPGRWSAVLIALLIVPSHLIWKPYFVLSLPVAAVLLTRDRTGWLPILILLAVNFTGFNFLGHHLGALFEAAAVLFLAHLVMIARAAVADTGEAAS